MHLHRRAILPLRAALVLLFGILLVFQLLSMPGQFAHMADESPELGYLRWPLTAASVFMILCVQLVIVCTWRLLGMVRDDRIFTDAALPWVDTIVVAIGAAWLVLLAVLVGLAGVWDDPGLPLLLTLLLVGGATLGLVVVVMRALLRQATTLRTDLEGVI